MFEISCGAVSDLRCQQEIPSIETKIQVSKLNPRASANQTGNISSKNFFSINYLTY